MKNLTNLRNIALGLALVAAPLAVNSCTQSVSPHRAAAKLASSAPMVYSYNDQGNPSARLCDLAGPLPDRAANALDQWLKKSEVKSFSYVYPQYFVSMTSSTGVKSVWALCSDGQGNLVGVMIPRGNVPAWDLSFYGNYDMYVCQGSDRKALSDGIMQSLSAAGYDKYRIASRKATGLTENRYLISEPLSEEETKRIEEERKEALKLMSAPPAGASSSDDDYSSSGSSSSSSDDEDEDDEDDNDDSSSSSSSDDDDDWDL